MTTSQKTEWELRKLAAHDAARDAFAWAVRNGIPAGEARHAVQKVVIEALGSGKVPE